MPSLHIRNIDAATVERLNRAARARGMTQGEYVTALVELHAALIRDGSPTSAVLLGYNALDPVTT